MTQLTQYASFLVRFWRQRDGSDGKVTTPWQSEVEHIQSGKTWKFYALDELTAFLSAEIDVLEELEWTESQDIE